MKFYNLILKSKKYFIFLVLCYLIQTFIIIFEVYLFENLINKISNNNIKNITTILYLVIPLTVFYIWSYIQQPIINFCKERLTINMQKILDKDIFNKLTKISYKYFEIEETQKLINTVNSNSAEHLVNYYNLVLTMFCGFISSIGVLFFIIQAGIIYVLGIILLLCAMLLLFKYCSKINIKLFDIRRELVRKEEYLSSLIFDRETAMERKLFSSSNFIQDKVDKEVKEATKKLQKSLFKKDFINLVYNFSNYFFAISAYIFLLKPLLENKITLGLYIALIPALIKVGNFFVSLLDNYLVNIKTEKHFFNEFDKFQNLEEDYYIYNKNDIKKSFNKIVFKNVSFSYEDKPVINNLNLTIEKGKSYALVGKNGAGKSTLIKLLLGLYNVDSGDIYIDDKNYKNMSFSEKASYFSVIFQDFGKYELTIEDNILLGRDKNNNLQNICEESQLKEEIEKLPKGINTFLGKLEEDGVDLSGGQWQKIAIARMFYEKKQCFIMDEPTSALDSIMESKFYEQCSRYLNKENTSIFISHRLGSTAIADEIIVLDNGQVIEKGTHNELINKNGVYKEMFETQRGYYA